MFTWSDAKNKSNQEKHRIAFENAASFDWVKAIYLDRSRPVDGEKRYGAISDYDGKRHVIIFTIRRGLIHIISFRRTNAREDRIYEENR
jgi:uncharacterized DUF497 family protein